MKQRIAIVQRDIIWRDVEANLKALEEIFYNIEADVIVLSEMFQTGFVVEPKEIADNGTTLRWMQLMAQKFDTAIVGSVATSVEGRYYNRLYFVMPDGKVEWYDKHHLFSIGGEAERYTAGNERKVVHWRGINYLLEICYDLRFPVWSRCRGDYDAIIYSALWPKPRREVWRTLLRARAIENQAYVIGVNRTGREPGLEYSGDSAVIDYRGCAMVDMAANEGVEVVEIDSEALGAFRAKFNVARDADSFNIG